MIRLLVDENLPPDIARRLRGSNYDAVHVDEVGLHSADDAAIKAWARGKGRAVITQDHDFEKVQRPHDPGDPSVILISQRHDEAVVGRAITARLREVLHELEPGLTSGVVVTLNARTHQITRPGPVRLGGRERATTEPVHPSSPPSLVPGAAPGPGRAREGRRTTPSPGRRPADAEREAAARRGARSRPTPARDRHLERSREPGGRPPDRGRGR